MATIEPAIDALFSVPDLPKLLFSWLDPSSLALAAWVCTKWRDTAREVRGEGKQFRLILADLVPYTRVLDWADANIMEVPSWLQSRICAMAAGKGALTTLQWAQANGCEWDIWTCANAAGGGHLSVLQWARKNGCLLDIGTCTFAARGGHLAVLRWARENGCKWDTQTCALAALNGHLAVLQWAHENGCEWGEFACTWAANNGHLEVLRWARKNGCPWNKQDCLRKAKECNHALVVAWIEAQPE